MAPTSKPKPSPDAYRRVTPCQVVQGGAKAREFYAEVFGRPSACASTAPAAPSPSPEPVPRNRVVASEVEVI